MNKKIKRKIISGILISFAAISVITVLSVVKTSKLDSLTSGGGYIKWVDFGVTAEAMNDAFEADIGSYGEEIHIDWIDILACLGAENGGNFSRYKKSDTERAVQLFKNGKTADELSLEMKFFSYYKEAYSAVLSGYVGDFEKNGESRYGLRVFSPIANGYYFSHYDDFGASRSYGYKRVHLGHDLMGSVGTPIIAVESGYVEAIGWNQYGGWRIGIRSFDNKRYYYYAHLRKDHPYTDIALGDTVTAGDVIGYLGMTGYSVRENVNNINVPHLHFGIQLIFDAAQKDGNNQIWIDCYEIVKFLNRNKMSVVRADGEKEYRPGESVIIYDLPD